MQTKQAIPSSLAVFDELPDAANIRLPAVAGLYGLSPASIWRGVKAGRIPQPRKLSPGVTVWNVGELRRALAPKTSEGTP
jgi:predicted DNA-binding transcriptional regulator AlpA